MPPAWRWISTASDDDLAAYAGRSTASMSTAELNALVASSQTGHVAPSPADAATLRRYIAQWSRAGYGHWADLPRAAGWFAEAARLTSDAEEARLDALGDRDGMASIAAYHAQINATTAALQALANGYRALDIPWAIDPVFRRAIESRFKGVSRNPCEVGTWADKARPYAYVSSEGGQCIALWERYAFGADSTIDTRYVLAGEVDEQGRGLRDRWTHWYGGARPDGRMALEGVWWRSWALYHDCLSRPTGGECADWESWYLPPPHDYFLLAREVARQCVARGPLRVLAESMEGCFLLNARAARAMGLLERIADASGDGQDIARGLAGVAQMDLARAQALDTDNVSGYNEMKQAMISAIGRAGGPIWGIIAAIFYGLIELIAESLPAAVMRVQDVFRRDQPALERGSITGGVTARQPPTHDVPDPPAASSPRVVMTWLPSPAPGGDAPPAREWHPYRGDPRKGRTKADAPPVDTAGTDGTQHETATTGAPPRWPWLAGAAVLVILASVAAARRDA